MASLPGRDGVHPAATTVLSGSCRISRAAALSSTTSTREPREPFAGTILPEPLRVADAEPDGEVERACPTPGSLSSQMLPAHQLHQPAADGEPQAGAAVLARRGHVGLRERLEQLRRLLLRHADAGVAHRELELHLLAGALEQLDVRAGSRRAR